MQAESPVPATPPPARRRRLIAGFLVGLLVLDLLIFATRDTWRQYDPHDYRDRLLACQDGAWDCLLVGGSPVNEGLDPAVLEGLSWRGGPLRSVFNLGLPGGTTSEAYHAARHGLLRPPRLIIYGLTASDVNDARSEPQGPRQLINLLDVIDWCRLRPSNGWWCVRHYARGQAAHAWNLYAHRRGLRLWLAHQFPTIAPEAAAEAESNLRLSKAIVHNHGYAPRPHWRQQRLDRLKTAGWQPPPFDFLNDFRLDGQFRYLERLIDWAHAQDAAIVLVDMPVSAELEEHRFPDIYTRYRAALRELARSRQVLLLDGSRRVVGLDERHFADLVHLNAAGTRRLTGWLRGQLADDGSRAKKDVAGWHALRYPEGRGDASTPFGVPQGVPPIRDALSYQPTVQARRAP